MDDMKERERFVRLLRELGAGVVGSGAEDKAFKAYADALEPLARDIANHPTRGVWNRIQKNDEGEKEVRIDWSMVPFNPSIGECNPIAPPLKSDLKDGRAIADVTYDRRFEGHGGYLHGGYVTCHFDEMLGHATSLRKETVVTGTLTVYFRKPVPLYRPLHYEAWIENISGKKISAKATLHDGEILLCEAEALYIRLDAAKFEETFTFGREPR